MPDKEHNQSPALFHALHLEGRDRLSVTGVEDVSGFDENTVLLQTSLGELCIRGEELRVERIDLDAGALELRGTVAELHYDEPVRGGLLSRLFS